MYNSQESVNFTIKEEVTNDWDEVVTLATSSSIENKEFADPLITKNPSDPEARTRGKYENLNFNVVVLLDRLDEDALLPSCTVLINTKRHVYHRPIQQLPASKLERHITLDRIRTPPQRVKSTFMKCNKCNGLVQNEDDTIKSHAVNHLNVVYCKKELFWCMHCTAVFESLKSIYCHVIAAHHKKYNNRRKYKIRRNVDFHDKRSEQYKTDLMDMIKECFMRNCYSTHQQPVTSDVPKRTEIINTHFRNSISDVAKLSEYVKYVEGKFNIITKDRRDKDKCALCNELVDSTYSTMNLHCFHHLTRDFNLKPYLCVLCKSKYPTYDAVKGHIKSVHNDEDFFGTNYKFDVDLEMREMADKCFPKTIDNTQQSSGVVDKQCDNLLSKDNCNYEVRNSTSANVLVAHDRSEAKPHPTQLPKCSTVSSSKLLSFPEIIKQKNPKKYPIIVKILPCTNNPQSGRRLAESVQSATIQQRDSVDQCRLPVTMSHPSVPSAAYPTVTATVSKKLRLDVTAQSSVVPPHCENSTSSEFMIIKKIKEEDCCPAIVKEEPTDDMESGYNLSAVNSASATKVSFQLQQVSSTPGPSSVLKSTLKKHGKQQHRKAKKHLSGQISHIKCDRCKGTKEAQCLRCMKAMHKEISRYRCLLCHQELSKGQQLQGHFRIQHKLIPCLDVNYKLQIELLCKRDGNKKGIDRFQSLEEGLKKCGKHKDKN